MKHCAILVRGVNLKCGIGLTKLKLCLPNLFPSFSAIRLRAIGMLHEYGFPGASDIEKRQDASRSIRYLICKMAVSSQIPVRARGPLHTLSTINVRR